MIAFTPAADTQLLTRAAAAIADVLRYVEKCDHPSDPCCTTCEAHRVLTEIAARVPDAARKCLMCRSPATRKDCSGDDWCSNCYQAHYA